MYVNIAWSVAVLYMECAGIETQLIVFFCVPRETGRLLLLKKHVHFVKNRIEGRSYCHLVVQNSILAMIYCNIRCPNALYPTCVSLKFTSNRQKVLKLIIQNYILAKRPT